MATAQAVMELKASDRAGVGARYVTEFTISLIVAVLFAALCSAYFAVNAGASYPEPSTVITD